MDIMIGRAMTPRAMAAPTPYSEIKRRAVTTVTTMVTTMGRSPASSMAPRMMDSAIPVFTRVCPNQAPKIMMTMVLA